ncbi:hypothetical protein SAMN03080606_04087, partial [Alkaliphilus peptidifermentans DSM 18978]
RNRPMDEKTHKDDLLEAVEENQNEIHKSKEAWYRRRQSLGICKHKKELLANSQ